MALIYLSVAWVLGILLGAKFSLPLVLALSGLIPLPLLLFRRHYRAIVLTSLCLVTFFSGAGYFEQSLPETSDGHLQFYNDRGTVTIKGMVSQDPDVREKTSRLYLQASEIKLDGGWQEVQGNTLLFVPRYTSYSYGDILLVTGEPETPPSFSDFDYQDCVVTIASSATGSTPAISMF